MTDMKNLDPREREKLFNELNDTLSQMQHKFYENEKKESRSKRPKVRSVKEVSKGKSVLYEGFNPKTASSWLTVYKRKYDIFSKIGLGIKGILFSLLFQLPFNIKPTISVNNLIAAKKIVKKFPISLINYRTKKAEKEFAYFFIPIMEAANSLSSIIKNVEQKELYLFLKALSDPYILGTSIEEFLNEFSETKIREEFQSKGIHDAFRYMNTKKKKVPGIFKQNLPESLVEAFSYLEAFKNFGEFVSWSSFIDLFGLQKEKLSEIKKLPKIEYLLPFLVQIDYVLKQMPDENAAYENFVDNFEATYKDVSSKNSTKSIDLDYPLIKKALDHLHQLKETNVVYNLISIIVQDDDFLILGQPLHQSVFIKQFLNLTQQNIENLLFLIREEEVKSYTQHVMKEFLISTGDLSIKVDMGIYSEENSSYLRSIKITEGFPFSILLPLVSYYFKYIYPKLASPFLATLGFKIDYTHKGIKKGFVDMINSLSWSVTELNYFIRDNLLVRGDSVSALVRILQTPSGNHSSQTFQTLTTQVHEINLSVRKCLQNIMKILIHLREEIFSIRDDLLNVSSRSIVLTRNIAPIHNTSFSTALYKVSTELGTLLESSAFYFPVGEYKGELFTVELSKNYKSNLSQNVANQATV